MQSENLELRVNKAVDLFESYKTRKEKRLKSCDLSWFSIENYASVSRWDLGNWSRRLSWVSLVLRMAKEGWVDDFLEKYIISTMASNEVNKGSKYGTLVVYPRVREKRLHDLWLDVEILNHPKFTDVRSNIERLQNDMEDASVDQDLLDKSLDDVHSERIHDLPEKMLLVDLNATDDTLVSDFKAWLASKRASLKSCIPKSDFNTDEWCKYNILAFLDLELLTLATGTTLSNATIGALLFPGEFDVDLSERIRKVVRPMSQKIINSKFLTALEHEAAKAEA